MNFNFAGAADAYDIGFLMGALNSFNEQFNRYIAAMERVQESPTSAAQWVEEMQGYMALVAAFLESKFPFIESGQTFEGLDEAARILGRSDLLSVFKEQQEVAAMMERELPDASSARLLAILDKLISTLEQQGKRASVPLFVRSDALRNAVQSGPRSSRRQGGTIVERIARGDYKAK